MAPSPDSISEPERFFAKGSRSLYSAPHPLMLSAGFSLFPSVCKLPGLPRKSPRHNSRVPVPGASLNPWRRQLCGQRLAPASSFSQGAGRELAGLRPPCHRCCACAAFGARRSHAAGAVTTAGREEGACQAAVRAPFFFL